MRAVTFAPPSDPITSTPHGRTRPKIVLWKLALIVLFAVVFVYWTIYVALPAVIHFLLYGLHGGA